MSEPDKKTKDQIQDDRLNDHWSKIEVLEKKLNEYSDYMVKVRRIQQDHTKQIAELKEWKEAIVNVINFYTDKEIIHKEVLRDYMEYMKNFNPQSWVEVNKLLKKLKE